ncbi:MAG: hypothetical protein MJ097_08080, partial [Dorea sp.]|nr:hypothetical protein [Dorea sp.]
MTIPEAIGAVVLFTTLSIMLLCTIKGVHSVSIYQYMLLLLITVAAILLLAYCFDPRATIRFDLGEHFKLLDKMKTEGWSYAVKNSEYGRLYVTLAYFWLIAETGLNHLLPILPMLTEFAVVIYIIYDLFYVKHDYMIDITQATFTLFVWFCTYGFLLALSGVRCSWAVAIAVAALYRDCVQKKRDLLMLLLYIMPMFIHYFAMIALILRLMIIMKHKKIMTLFMIGAVVYGPQLAIIIYRSVSFSYVRTMMAIIVRYWSGFSVWTFIAY